MKKIEKLRDLIWPMLAKDEGEENKIDLLLDEQLSFVDENNVDKAIEVALMNLKDEDDRRASIESKAALFIGTFSVAVTILIGVVKDFISNMDLYPPGLSSAIVILTSIIILYLCRAALYSVDALRRKNYYTLGIPDFLYNGNENYKQQLFLEIRNNTYRNRKCINEKVDSMTMAQEFFKCAVRTSIILVGIVLILFVINLIY